MIVNNLWNRLFHKKKVDESKAVYLRNQRAIAAYDSFENMLYECTDLTELLNIHKLMWFYNFRNKNLGPCSYGMFRTKETIEHMTPDEVYLGGIFGIFTNNISFYESHKDEKFGENGWGIDPEISVYDVVLDQYKSVLYTNLRELYRDFVKYQNLAEIAGLDR